MSLYYLVGVIMLASFANTSMTGAEVFHSNSSNCASVLTVNKSGTSTNRLLRSNSAAADDVGERAGLSVPEKLKMLFTSSKVTDEQLQRWLDKGKSSDIVFARMHLDQTRSRLFDNPQVSKWLRYVDDLSAISPGKETSAISTLTAQYGDDTLYRMIEAASKVPSTKNLPRKLQAEQIQHWITARKEPGEVFQLFNLQNSGSRILRNPRFTVWTKYVDDLNAKTADAASIIPTLKKYYNNHALFKMIEAAKTVTETKHIAGKLEDAFVQLWMNSKKTPDDVLVLLDLERTTTGLLENPLFSLLAKFVEAYNMNFPDTKFTMIETLTQRFGDRDVAKMLLAAKAEGVTKDVATKLESVQLKMWLSSGFSVGDIYRRLKLSETVNDPLLSTWISYTNTVIMENPSKASTLFSAIEARFSDRSLTQILEAAKKFPSMEAIATKMSWRTFNAFSIVKNPRRRHLRR